MALPALGADQGENISRPAALDRVQRLHAEARGRALTETNSAEAAWQLGRACYDRADFSTNDTERAALANEGINAGRGAIALEPGLAAGHYYLGLNFGQLAQTRLLGALKLIDEMEAAWKKTIELDQQFDFAGAHRAIGIRYRDAPGWPTSIGSRDKSRKHLQKAVELSPDYPGNQIALLESQLKWGEKKTVQTQVAAVEKVLKTAREKLTGERWALDWDDWGQRWEKIKTRAAVVHARNPRADP